MTADPRPAIIDAIADTFDFPADQITDSTQAADVDGWDSLAHTVLMVRIGRALGIRIPEELAANAQTVGELIAGCRALLGARA